jgi:hypothetical protein
MTMHYLDSLAYYDVAKDGKEGEDGWEGRFAVHNEERYVVDFEAIGQVSHTCSASVRVSDDNHLVAAIDEFLRVSV